MIRQSEKREHLLERAYLLQEENKFGIEDLRNATLEHPVKEGLIETLKELEDQSLVALDDGTFRLTQTGERRAGNLLRRHRLAERLLSDVFQMDYEEMESQACKFEHVLSPEVTDSICAFLGHPTHCPHGKSIPRGECCRTFSSEIHPVVVPLKRVKVGSAAKIIFTTPAYHKRYERLTLLGVTPGAFIKLYQKLPSYVIKVGETEIALDGDVAEEIFVRPLDDGYVT